MSTAAELRVELQRLQSEETRLRAEYDAFGTQISSLSDQLRPINAEIRNQKSIIQDPNATEAQKSAATIRGQELESQYNNINRQITLIRDQQTNFLNNQLRPVQNKINSPRDGIKTRIQTAEQQEQREASAAEAKKNEEDRLAIEKENADREARIRAQVAGQPAPGDAETVGEEAPANDAQTETELTEEERQEQEIIPTETGEGDPSAVESEEGSETENQSDAETKRLERQSANASEAKSPIVPQVPIENPLHLYDSYNYALSFYVLSMDEYERIQSSPESWSPRVDNLLISSGGRYGSSRNAAFRTDFYIEDLEFTTVLASSSQNRNSNLIEGSFRIVEPLGFTFINRLITAANGVITAKSPRYEQQPYLIKLEFFGIKDGEIKSTPIDVNDGKQQINTTKYFPIIITNMSAEITEKGGEYKVTFVPFAHQSLLDRYMNIQTNFNIEGTTVEEFLGPIVNNDAQVEGSGFGGDTGNATTDTQYPKSLAAQINRYYHQLSVKNGTPVASKISFEIDPTIAKKRVIIKKSSVQSQSSTGQVNQAQFKFTKGQKIDRAIDYIIRNSEFFTNQLDTNKEKNATDQPLTNFKVIPKIKHIGYDKILNSNIYETTYVIKPFFVTSNHSEGIKPKPEGSVKEYNYIFTGKNTDILDFKIEFNMLYFQTISAFKNARSLIEGQSSASANENKDVDTKQSAKDTNEGIRNSVETTVVAPQTIQTNQSSLNGIGGYNSAVSDTAASVIEDLLNTSKGDMINVNLKIIGDPLFIKQDDFFYTPQLVDNQEFLTKNGSYIMDRGELYVLLKFITPQDYDETTGLTDLSSNSQFGYSEFSGYYKVITIKNSFSGGRFEQTLDLVRVLVDETVLKKAKERAKELDSARAKEVVRLIQLPPTPTFENLNQSVKALAAKAQGGGDLLSIAKAGGDIVNEVVGIADTAAGGITDVLGKIGTGVSSSLTEVGDAIQNSDLVASARRLSQGLGLPEGISPENLSSGFDGDPNNFSGGLVDSDGNPVRDGFGNQIQTTNFNQDNGD